MSNRKRMKNNALRLKKVAQRGLGKVMEPGEPRPHIPTGDEIFGVMAQLEPEVAEVIKEVPAKVDGVVVGTAYLHDDGSVAIKFDDNAPQWALDKIKATEAEVGYSLETGGPNGSA